MLDAALKMILTLEIVNDDGLKAGVRPRVEFREKGGTIGRAKNSYWQLPNPGVSATHARIHFNKGQFSIEDAGSTNGVFLNSRDDRLTQGVARPLYSGDFLIIDPYEIRVEIVDDGAGVQLQSDRGLSVSKLFPPPKPRGPGNIPIPGPIDPVFPEPRQGAGRGVDIPIDWADRDLMPSPSPTPAPPTPAPVLPTPPPAPTPRPAPAPNPSPTPTPNLPPPTPPVRPSNDCAGMLDLAEVLRAAGLNETVVAPDVAADFGHILRVVIAGLMDVLQARQRLREAFRIQTTTYRPREHNPLKSATDVQDALHRILVQRHPSYLNAVDAFEGAFADIRDHEVAMLAGMRAAFEAMLSKFDPAALSEEFDRQSKRAGALISLPGKLRYWELYTAKIHDMVRDPDACFRGLFGDEFANAYEEQLRRLKASRSDASRDLDH